MLNYTNFGVFNINVFMGVDGAIFATNTSFLLSEARKHQRIGH